MTRSMVWWCMDACTNHDDCMTTTVIMFEGMFIFTPCDSLISSLAQVCYVCGWIGAVSLCVC